MSGTRTFFLGQERDVTDKNVVVQKPDNRYNIEKKVRKCRY